MTALAEYQRSLEPTEAEVTAELHKDLAAGAYARCTAPDSTPGKIEKRVLLDEIQARANERFPELPTPQRRFAHAIDADPHGRPYDKVAHSLYQAAKAAPGRDTAPVAAPAYDPRDPLTIARARGPNHVHMHYAARAIQDRRGSTYESSYSQAFTDPNNVGIKSGMMAEQESPKSLTMEEARALSPEVRPFPPYEGHRPIAGTSDAMGNVGHVGARPAGSITRPRG